MKKVILSLLVLSGLATSYAAETEAKKEGDPKVVLVAGDAGGSASGAGTGGSGAKDADLVASTPISAKPAPEEPKDQTGDKKKKSRCNLL